MRTITITILIMAALVALSQPANSKPQHGSAFAKNASDSIVPFIAIGELTLFLDGKKGEHEALQGAKALVVNSLATQLLKVTVREKRPDGSSRSSFPSLHTSAAFTMATVLSEYKPKYTIPAYAIAATIGWSRVDLRAHFTRDVVAGALLGHYIGRHFAKDKRLVLFGRGIGYRWKW